MSKNKLVENFNQHLKDGLAANHLGRIKGFKQELLKSNGAERIEALHALLQYNNPNNLDLKPAAIESALWEAVQAILERDPNILESHDSQAYPFAIVNSPYENVRHHLVDHLRKNTKPSTALVTDGTNCLDKVLSLQLLRDPKAVSHFITTCNHHNDARGQKLLDEIVNLIAKAPSTMKRTYQDTVIKALKEGMQISEAQFKQLDLNPYQLNDMLVLHVDTVDRKEAYTPFHEEPSRLNDNLFKQALTLLKEKEGPDSNLSVGLLEQAISKNNPKFVCDMAMRGFKINSHYDKYSRGRLSTLAKELLDNKNILTKTFGNKELTENDQQRIVLLTSSGMEKKAQAEFLKNNKGISPLKLAIDTKQFDIAAKMIADGASLKPSELSLGLRVKNAIGMVDMKLETNKALESKAGPKAGPFVKKLKQQRAGTAGKGVQ